MLRTARASSDIRLGSQGGSHTILTLTSPTPGYAGGRVFHHGRQFLRRGAIGRGERHLDRHGAIVGDVDLVDQAELVDVGRDFRIVDGLERRDDAVGQPRQFVFRQRGWRAGAGRGRSLGRRGGGRLRDLGSRHRSCEETLRLDQGLRKPVDLGARVVKAE